MATTLKYIDGAKKEHLVVLADDYEFPADEGELSELVGKLDEQGQKLSELVGKLDEQGQTNLRAWKQHGTTDFKEPLTLDAIEDDAPEAA